MGTLAPFLEPNSDGRIDVQDFQYTNAYKNIRDWRLPENRLEGFYRVAYTRMMEGELDHWMVGKVIADYMDLNEEQKAWYCLLFGFSYRNHWPMIFLQTFPDPWEVSDEKIEMWYNNTEESDGTWSIVNFAKDTKWNVRKFPEFIKSIKHWCGNKTLREKLHETCTVGSRSENFHSINNALKDNLYGIGRMTSWLTIQTVYEFFDYDINHWDLQLDDSSCWSQFQAMAYLFNRDDLYNDKELKLTDKIKGEMYDYSLQLQEYVSRSPFTMDVYNIESCLCEYRKTMKGNKKGVVKEFTYWTANELIYEYDALKKDWENREIDWTPYVLGISTKGDNFEYGMDKIYFQVNSKTGLNFNTHAYFKDEPNAYELLNIPRPSETFVPPIFLQDLEKISDKTKAYYRDKFHPQKHLRWIDGQAPQLH